MVGKELMILLFVLGISGTGYAEEPKVVLLHQTTISHDTECLSCITNVNYARKINGLPELQIDERLMQTCKAHSETQFRNRSMYHGPHTGWSGECVAWGADTGREVFVMWWNSRGHRNIMMSRSARKIGVGRAGTYWTLQVRNN